jgi:hypothetical protein
MRRSKKWVHTFLRQTFVLLAQTINREAPPPLQTFAIKPDLFCRK